ncbi:MAG: hypothetical protein QOD77_221 [Thermoplasmata archaeon]|jgi:hypothetical protein|nr:hypothetical protein [Thermoplasmata archaeon]
MRTFGALTALALALTALAGCSSSGGDGTLNVHVTDAPGAIGDFTSLTITVSSIELKHKGNDGVEKTDAYTPDDKEFDLAKLTNGNVTTIFGGKVANGTYTKMEFIVASATGVLAADGKTVQVDAPKGSIFVNTQFTVGDGSEVDFVFDIHVVAKGNGGYSLQPNAGGSKVVAKPTNGKIPQ